MKQCNRCFREFPEESFPSNGTYKGRAMKRPECRECRKMHSRDYSWRLKLEKVFGITPEFYYEMLKMQNNQCAICSIEMEKTNKRLIVDHDHETGLIRGLLCDSCNLGIGKLKDSEELLMKAANYIANNKIEIKEGDYHS